MINFEALKKIGANQFQMSTVDNRKQQRNGRDE